MKFCTKCKNQVENDDAFCGTCGYVVSSEGEHDTSTENDYQKESNKKRILALALTIVAFFAACALAFFNFNLAVLDQGDNDSNGEVVLSPGVLIYDDGQSPFQILASDYYSVTVSSLDGIDDEVILAAGVSEETPYGLLRRIDSIEVVDEGYRITTIPAALIDAIEECDISFVVVIAEDGDYEIIYGDGEITSLFGPAVAHAAFLRLEHKIDHKEDFGTFSTGLALEVSLRVHRGDITMRVVLHCFAGADLSLTRVEWERRLMQAGKPLTFFVGPLPVVLVNSIEVKAGVSAEVSALALSLDVTLDRSIGFEYSTQRGLTRINEDNSRWPQTRLNPEEELFSATLNAKIEVIFSTRIYGLAGPELSAAVQGEASAELRKVPDGVDADGAIVVPGLDWRLSGSYRERVTVPISGRFVLKVPNFNPFSSRTRVIANIEVFNTGDAITLLDVNKEFGHPVMIADPAALMGVWEALGVPRYNLAFDELLIIDERVDTDNFRGEHKSTLDDESNFFVVEIEAEELLSDGTIRFSGVMFVPETCWGYFIVGSLSSDGTMTLDLSYTIVGEEGIHELATMTLSRVQYIDW